MNGGFNIFGKLTAEIDDFEREGVYIVGKPDSKYVATDRRGERGGYYYSQRQTLEAIDLASASKFKRGIWDEEGQRKTFLNIVNFYRDVMKMKINIGVKDYILMPLSRDWTWVVWLFERGFKIWASMNDYDDQIDEYAHDLATYGSTVSKRAGDCTERVPLRTLRNTPTAKSLYHAAAYGGYVIIEDEFHYNEMEKYPDWMIDHLDPNKTYCTFERYALVPEGLLKKWKDMSDLEIANYVMQDDERMVLAIAILIPEGVAQTGEEGKGESLIYLEELDEDTWPLDECHTNRQDGRWLGVGEIEKQLEAQISRNLTANYARRSILWGARKIFQSTDDDIQQNLVYEVADGEVLHIKPNGTITQVNTESKQGVEFSNDDARWKENSEKSAFAFEVATGQSLPSGTPFRLGVVLSQAVASHFALTRETFSNFLKRCFFDQIIPIYKREYAHEHDVIISLGESDLDSFREDIIVYHTNIRIWDAVLAGRNPDSAIIRGAVEQELAKNKYAFVKIPPKFFDNAEFYMKLNLTDDTSADISDLTTLLQTMAPNDPQRENVLRNIYALRGKALPALRGPAVQAPAPEATQETAAAPSAAPAPVAAPMA